MTARLAQHIAETGGRELPADVVEKTCLHILDTIAAMVSGTQLPAGEKALPFAAASAGSGQAQVIGSGDLVPATIAALANGMLAHADETDDSHARSLTHPGCAVVPAALALCYQEARSGVDLVRAVCVGYDVGPRISEALGADRFFDTHHTSHSYGGLFGAAAAAGAVLRLDAQQSTWLLAYAVQMASGNPCWRRDPHHVEKAFDFGGMPAHNAVLAAQMVRAGFTGSAQPLEGTPGLFAAFPATARPELATQALGERFEVMHTAIKKWCVGSPIQAALDSLQHLMQAEGLRREDVASIVVDLPRQSTPVVDNRDMPDLSLQHQLALMLVDGTVSFASGHDASRMQEPALRELRGRISIRPRDDAEFNQNMRQAIVTVQRTDGGTMSRRTEHVRGTPRNPMTSAEVVAKAMDLMEPVLGTDRTRQLVRSVMDAIRLPDVRALRPLLVTR